MMDNAAYITLSRQIGLMRDMEVTANNLANTNTTGYQSSHILFHNYLVNDGLKSKMAFANDISTYRNTDVGSFSTTGNDLDVAIQGEGYFSVETPLGTRYTRGGNFQIDPTGTLTTAEGYPVLDQNNQRIILPEDARDIVIGEAGNIAINGEALVQLGVVNFENPQLLEKAGDRLLKSDAEPIAAQSARVAQGMLENSNVEPVKAIVHVVDVSRMTQTTTKMIETVYDLHRRTGDVWTSQG